MTTHFGDWLRGRVGPNWVVAARTKRIVERYGPDVVALSQRRYTEMEEEYERLTGQSASDPGKPSRFIVDAAQALYEALKLALEHGDMGPTGVAGKAARIALAKAEGRRLRR